MRTPTDSIDRARVIQIGVKSRFVGYGDGAACTVEGLVLQHLSQVEEGSWAGWHCEGSPVRGLWALLMWDVIFMDVPEVFQVKKNASGSGTTRMGTRSVLSCFGAIVRHLVWGGN